MSMYTQYRTVTTVRYAENVQTTVDGGYWVLRILAPVIRWPPPETTLPLDLFLHTLLTTNCNYTPTG